MRLFFLLSVFFFGSQCFAQEIVIKAATVAPEGSVWMKVMNKMNEDIKKESGGRLSFKFFSGGVLGDDKTVLDKMKYGQVQAAGFTGVGLGYILPEVRVMELPFHFSTYKQLDCTLSAFSDEFAKKFEEKGFILLGWADQGFVYLFSKKNISSANDMKTTKPWVWESDPLAKAVFTAFGLNPVPLSLQDVFTSLQTGLVDTVYISPVAAIALQWYTKVETMVDLPIVDGIGAFLMSKEAFDKLPEDLKKLLKEKSASYLKKLSTATRQSNDASIKILKEKGIRVVSPNENEISEFRKKGEQAARSLVGKLYSSELLEGVKAKASQCK